LASVPGIDLHRTADNGWSGLHAAAAVGAVDIARFMIAAGMDVDIDAAAGTPLKAAITHGHTVMVETLLECGALARRTDAHGRNALHAAVEEGRHHLLGPLLNSGGINVNAGDHDQITPMHIAAGNGDVVAIDQLTAAGADLERETVYGDTALMHAVVQGEIDACDRLLAHGANVEHVTCSGARAVHEAASSDLLEMFELLLGRGGDVAARDRRGNTVAHHAAIAGTTATLASIVASGVAVDDRNRAGETPLHLAAGLDNDAVELLIRAGVDINAVDEHGLTPLDRALIFECETSTIWLIAFGGQSCTPPPRTRRIAGTHPLTPAADATERLRQGERLFEECVLVGSRSHHDRLRLRELRHRYLAATSGGLAA